MSNSYLIAQKSSGKCDICGKGIMQGQKIDIIPWKPTITTQDGREFKNRGHLSCILANEDQSAAMRQITPPPPVAHTPQHHAPAGSSSPLSGSRGDTHRALLQIAQGFDMIRAGLDVLIALVADRAA